MQHTQPPPEDLDAIRQRDLGKPRRRDTSGAYPHKRGVHGNPKDMGASTGRRTARSRAWVAGHEGPPEAREVLANGSLYGHRFTDTQWLVLTHAYGPDKRTDSWIEKHNPGLGDKGTIRKARLAAEATCFELIREYKPTCTKRRRIKDGNPRGEKLTLRETRLLHKHDRPKKGRKIVTAGYALSPEVPDGADVGQTGSPLAAQAEWEGVLDTPRSEAA